MKFWMGVTDNRWYEFVRSRGCTEVNFWQPSARRPFSGVPEGTPFLFKLKRPFNHVAGGGYFVRFTTLPLATAWDAFGEAHGAPSLPQFARLIASNSANPVGANPDIGCNVLTNVFFLPRERWIEVSERFPKSAMQGATRDTADPIGQSIWDEVAAAARGLGIAEDGALGEQARFGRSFLTQARLGQGAFRTLVTDAYKRRCAVTGETTLPVLEAAHIRSYADEGPHAVSNGLLLRSDFHKLFDLGLVTVQPDYRIRVSKRIHEQWFNGKAYNSLDGKELRALPDDPADHPNPEYLRWHNEERFVA